MLRGPTILVIDDEAASRMGLRKVLAGAGYQFAGASTGTEALERMSTEKCEMIILDPALADMDGFELIRLIRRQSLMRIITLSTSDDERSKVRAFDLGADDYVTKPFAEGELLARLRRHSGIVSRQGVSSRFSFRAISLLTWFVATCGREAGA